MSRLQDAVQQLKSKNQLILDNTDRALGLLPLSETTLIQQELNEVSLSKKVLQGLAGKGPNKGKPRIEIFADKIKKGEEHIQNNGETVVISQVTMNDKKYNKTKNGIKGLDMDDLIKDFDDVKSFEITKPVITIKDKDTGLAKTPEYGGEGGGEKISTSTQELMTAAIVLIGKKYDAKEIDVKDAAIIIEEAKKKWKKIKGVEGAGKLLNQFTDNWYDLATAISSANAILDIVSKPTKVFWTGQKWDKEIAPFNPPIGRIKNYNSSDIVVAAGKRYYGFSLKKKKSTKDADPTLINKPITGAKSMLKDFVSASDIKTIETEKKIFFINLLYLWAVQKSTKGEFKNKVFLKKYPKPTRALIKKMDDKEFNGWIKKIPNTFVNDVLAGNKVDGVPVDLRLKNIFWQTIDKVLKGKSSKKIMVGLLKLIFRVDLAPILKESGIFDFYLLTGIGNKLKTAIGVEPAEVKDLPSTVESLSQIFKEDKINLGTTVNDSGVTLKLPWEYKKKDKAPAKLRYTIYNAKTPLMNIEIRYKGSKTAAPQFQATATPIFKNLMSGK